MEEESAATQTPVVNGEMQDLERERQISHSLQSTIAAFSARWLPVTSGATGELDSLDIVQKLWRYARRNMLKVINRPTYRSMLVCENSPSTWIGLVHLGHGETTLHETLITPVAFGTASNDAFLLVVDVRIQVC